MATAASMYIRIKRQKTTIFLHIEPTDRVEAVKARIEELLQYPASKQRIYKTNTVLEDSKSLAEERIENDDVLVLALQNEDGTWETPSVVSYDEDTPEEEQ